MPPDAMDPYDRLIARRQEQAAPQAQVTAPATAAPGFSDPYDALLERRRDTTRRQSLATLSSAMETNPDEEAEIRTLAREQGGPVGVARAIGLQTLRRRDALRRSQDSERLSLWLTDEDFARIAHDDTRELSTVESIMSAMTPRGVTEAREQDRLGSLAYRLALGETLTADEMSELRISANNMRIIARENKQASYFDWIPNAIIYSGSQLILGGEEGIEGALYGASAGAGLGAGLGLAAGPGGASAGAVAGGLRGGLLGFAGGQAVYNYRLETGMAFLEYSQFIDDQGRPLDPAVARGAAHLTGAINTILETGADLLLARLALPGADRLFARGGKDLVGRLIASNEGRALLSRIATRAAQGATAEGLTEFVQEIVSIAMGEQAKSDAEADLAASGDPATFDRAELGESLSRALQAGARGAVGGGGLAAVTTPVQAWFAGRERRRTERAASVSESQVNRIEAAVEAAANTKLHGRDPAMLAQFIDDAASGGPAATLYIAPAELKQAAQELGIDVRELASRIGIDDGAIASAGGVAADLEVPVGTFVSKVAGSDIAGAVLEIIKTNPLLYSRRQIKQLADAGAEGASALAERLTREAEDSIGFRVGVDTIRTQISADLGTAGSFTKDVNDLYATVTATAYGTLAKRLGIMPQEAFTRFPLRVAADRARRGDVQALEQQTETSAFKRWFGNSRATDDAGKPLVLYHGTQADFESFEASKGGSFGAGIYLTDDKQIASSFGEGGAVLPVFASLQNPLVIDSRGMSYDQKLDATKEFRTKGARERLAAKGYDGVIYIEEGYREIVAFRPDQVKSATGNNGSFTAGSDNLLAQGERGAYIPAEGEIRLTPNADLSTFLHEMGHHFLEVYSGIASGLSGRADISGSEADLLADFRALVPELAKGAGVEVIGDDPAAWFAALPFEQKVPLHEQFARMMEAYFLTGKAPVPTLRSMFATFRRWLLNVYRSIRDLNVNLSDEVRGVMDRMFATAEQIRAAEQEQRMTPAFDTRPEFMSDQEWQAYLALAREATEDAETTLATRAARDMQWLSGARAKALADVQKRHAGLRREVEAEVRATVMAEPVYRARQFLKRGLDADGNAIDGPHWLSIDILEKRYPEGSGIDWTRLGYGQYGMLRREGGLDPDVVAGLTGFASGDEMIRALLAAPPPSVRIKAETDRVMLERHGDLTSPEKLAGAVDAAIHQRLRLRVMATEHAALARAIGDVPLIEGAAKQAAERTVARMEAGELEQRRLNFTAAERRAGTRAQEAVRKGEIAEAAAAKRDQMLNHAIAAEIAKAIEARDKALTFFRAIIRARKEGTARARNFDLVMAARAILASYGMGRVTQDPVTYLEKIKEYDPALHDSLVPVIAAAAARKDETIGMVEVERLLGLETVIRQIWRQAKTEMEITIEGRSMALSAAVAELTGHLSGIGVSQPGPATQAMTPGQTKLRMIEGAVAALRRVESWAAAVDGSAGPGPFTRYIWRPISQAADRYRADRARFVERFRDIYRAAEEAFSTGAVSAPEINYTFSGKPELLHAILHTGNESNKRKLLLGRKWGEVDEDGTLLSQRFDGMVERLINEGVLTQADFTFVQAIWDLLEETKPLAQKAHREVFGFYFDEITAKPFENRFGKWRGGYAPAIYDQMLVSDAVARANEEDLVGQNDSTMFPAPQRGFTKGRVEYNRELALDLRLLPQHLDKVLKFSHMAAPARQVLRVLRQPEFRVMLDAYDPSAWSDMLLPWLNRSAKQIVEMPTRGRGGRLVDTLFRTIRQRAGMGLMFANLVNTAQQVTGFSLSALAVKPRYLARGFVAWMRDPAGTAAAIHQASPMMARRASHQIGAMFGEIDAIVEKNRRLARLQDWFQRHAYFMQQAVQNVVDTATWLGAYEQEKANGVPEAEAAKRADAVVRQTQGSTLPEDVSRFEVGTPFWRSFAQFYGYFNMWANLLGTKAGTILRELGVRRGAGKLLHAYLIGFAAPALVAQALADGLRGRLPDDDDDDGYLDDWLAWVVGTQLRTAGAAVPIAGTPAVAIFAGAKGNPFDDRVAASPAISTIEAGARAIGFAWDEITGPGENDKSRAVKDVATLLTLLTGIPVMAAARPVAFAVDVEEGDIKPTGTMDYIRGLLTGTASEASR